MRKGIFRASQSRCGQPRIVQALGEQNPRISHERFRQSLWQYGAAPIDRRCRLAPPAQRDPSLVMMTKDCPIERRLANSGVFLPIPSLAAGTYVPYVISRGLVYISGQTARIDGVVICEGKVGCDVSLEQGKKAAQICAINMLAQLRHACDGDLSLVTQCVRLTGFVACEDHFRDQAAVLNAASEIIHVAFGAAGMHARTAVGVTSLPSGSAVEVDAIFEINDVQR